MDRVQPLPPKPSQPSKLQPPSIIQIPEEHQESFKAFWDHQVFLAERRAKLEEAGFAAGRGHTFSDLENWWLVYLRDEGQLMFKDIMQYFPGRPNILVVERRYREIKEEERLG